MHPRLRFSLVSALAAGLPLVACTADGTGGDDTATELTGTLGELGPLNPIVAGRVVEYSGETITYLSTVPLACEAMVASRWLLALDADAQIVEIVFASDTTDTDLEIGGPGNLEVHYAKGGRSSSYEETADSGTVTLIEHNSGGPIAGTLDATFTSPAGSLNGPFEAEFCLGGQEY